MGRRAYFWIGLLLGILVLILVGANGASADTPSPADRGDTIFQAHCSTCHGDRGQGLAEWRLTWDPLHQNCSQAKCHGLRHPPEGFYLPNNFAPKIIGDDTLTRFQTAQDLYNFVSKNMPFQEPGSLAAGDYWLIVTFLLQQHNVPVNVVTPQNARLILLRPAAESDMSNILPVLVGVGLAWTLAGGFVYWSKRRRKTYPRAGD